MSRLAIFDLAGTTLHDDHAVIACFRAALAEIDIAVPPEAVTAVMGIAKPVAIRMLLEEWKPEAATPENVQALHHEFVARMLRYYRSDPAVREIPGASATFAALRAAGFKLAVNTGFGRSLVDAIIARLGWADALDASLASDESPRGRPHPDMILTLAARLGIDDASRVAKIGDTVVDLQEGTSAGCGQVIGVLTGAFTRSQLEAHPHSAILPSVADVPGYFQSVGFWPA